MDDCTCSTRTVDGRDGELVHATGCPALDVAVGFEHGDVPARLGQSQASLRDQLVAVRALANRHGYYDAADFIGRSLDRGRA